MLVATGDDGERKGKNYTQVVDLSLTNDCATFPAYPISMFGAAGGLINNILTVCGQSNQGARFSGAGSTIERYRCSELIDTIFKDHALKMVGRS